MFPDNYTTASGVNFTFNNIALNGSAAEDMCNDQCGHLASYTSLTEQNDVEQFYIQSVGGPSSEGCMQWPCLLRLISCWHQSPAAWDRLTNLAPVRTLQGLLIPKFHKNYWMGLAPNWTSEAQPVPWGWIDQYQPGPDNKTWVHWGVLQDPPGMVPEPNQYLGNESCSAGNWSQAMGSPVGWGWADTNCNNTFYPLCRKQSELADSAHVSGRK
jgi:hypothetical protein